jgi:hypothetical protein
MTPGCRKDPLWKPPAPHAVAPPSAPVPPELLPEPDEEPDPPLDPASTPGLPLEPELLPLVEEPLVGIPLEALPLVLPVPELAPELPELPELEEAEPPLALPPEVPPPPGCAPVEEHATATLVASASETVRITERALSNIGTCRRTSRVRRCTPSNARRTYGVDLVLRRFMAGITSSSRPDVLGVVREVSGAEDFVLPLVPCGVGVRLSPDRRPCRSRGLSGGPGVVAAEEVQRGPHRREGASGHGELHEREEALCFVVMVAADETHFVPVQRFIPALRSANFQNTWYDAPKPAGRAAAPVAVSAVCVPPVAPPT